MLVAVLHLDHVAGQLGFARACEISARSAASRCRSCRTVAGDAPLAAAPGRSVVCGITFIWCPFR